MLIGDRGNVVINVPAPVVPYVPARPETIPDQFQNIPNRSDKAPNRSDKTSTRTDKTPNRTKKIPIRSKPIASSTKRTVPDSSTLSEDFNSFSTVTDRSTTEKSSAELAYQETDRIDVPNLLLPGAVVASSDPLSNKVSVAVPSVSEPGKLSVVWKMEAGRKGEG
jgi:hypothetical protein